jgi:hypothetical protein
MIFLVSHQLRYHDIDEVRWIELHLSGPSIRDVNPLIDRQRVQSLESCRNAELISHER